MIKSGKGGGNTRTGLVFEGKTDLSTFLSQQPHYSVMGHDVFYDDKKVAEVYKKHNFYSIFLKILKLTGQNIFLNACCQMIAFLC